MDQSANPPEQSSPARPRTPSDELPSPDLDPEVDAEIRALLAGLPDPGPMPAVLARRIEGALADEKRLRLARGALAGLDPDADVLAPLIRQRQRPKPWLAAAAVAAAAAVIAVGGSALHLNREANPVAAVGVTTTPSPSGSTSPAPATGMHVQQSTTDYHPGTFAGQVRSLLADPGAPMPDGPPEAPAVGPLASAAGLTSCLDALGEFPPYRVTADLALYRGEPAAIVAVTRGQQTIGYAVGRGCRPGNTMILRDATPIP